MYHKKIYSLKKSLRNIQITNDLKKSILIKDGFPRVSLLFSKKN